MKIASQELSLSTSSVTALRTLPLTLSPARALCESFASYADRLAAHLDVPLTALLYRTGLIPEQHFSALPIGYGVCLSPDALRKFAEVTRILERLVRDMMLASYDGVCWDASSLDTSSPDTLRKISLVSWAYFVGSHICPACLAEHGAWCLRWKLPWVFACVEHGVLLIDTCPGCGRRVAAGKRDGRTTPNFASLVPVPTACRNAPPKGMTSPGRSSRPCGFDLRTVDAPRVSSNPILDVQQRMDARLSGAEVYVAGEAVSTLEYFRDLRSLCALLLSVGDTEDLSEATGAACSAFAKHVRGRSELEEQRRKMVVSGEDWRAGPRARPYTGPPESASLMAAIAHRP